MGWAPAVTAIATAVIALTLVAIGGYGILFMRRISSMTAALEDLVDTMEREARPVLESAKSMVSETGRVVGKLGSEVEAITDTSEDLRGRVARAVDAVEDRLVDLEALLDVIQDEVEETVLDVGAALRTTRRGASILGSVKRTLLGKRRRRR